MAYNNIVWASLLALALAVGVAFIARQDLFNLKGELPDHHHHVFEDNFEYGLDAWENLSPDWEVSTPQHIPAGIELIPIDRSKHPLKALLLKHGPEFKDGVIECEAYLTTGAIFDVVVRGNIADDHFYMARLDSRRGGRQTDSIVVKPAGGNWHKCNQASTHHTPVQRWTRMRIEADGPQIRLYNNGQEVNHIDNAEIASGRIAIFAEISKVHIRRFRVTYTDT